PGGGGQRQPGDGPHLARQRPVHARVPQAAQQGGTAAAVRGALGEGRAMRTVTAAWAAGLMVVLLGIAGGQAQDNKEVRAARKDLLDLVKDLEAKKDVSGRTAELANTNEVGHLMRAFKPKNQGGIGVGKDGIGIERKLAQLSIRLLSDRALKQEK